jgi:hypothetical protein
MALFTFYRLAEAGQVVRDRHTLSPGSSGDELRGVLTSDTRAMLRAPSPRVVETLAHSHKESRRAYSARVSRLKPSLLLSKVVA